MWKTPTMPQIDAKDEYRHAADDADPLWNESYYLDWFTEDGSLGGYARIGFYPNLDRVWYWACLVGPDRKLISVVDHDVSMPADLASIEIRHDSLWADHVIESPLEHMSINLESYAVRLDDPADTYGEFRGEIVPFGFELDYFTDRGGYQWPPITPRYEIPCRVHGQVTIGEETIHVDGWGQRDHSWGGARDWWANTWSWCSGRLDDGTRFHSVGGAVPTNDLGIAYLLDGDQQGLDAQFQEFIDVSVACSVDDNGLFTSSTHRFGGMSIEFEPIGMSPVLLVHDDGRKTRFPRAMCRVSTDDGRTGLGWIEWNQPPGWTPPSI